MPVDTGRLSNIPPLRSGGPHRRWKGALPACLSLVAALAAPLPAWAQPAADEWLYPVVQGDTLIGVAARHLAPPWGWRELQRHNQIKQPRRLMPGRMLRIPEAWLQRTATRAEVVFVQGEAFGRSAGQSEWTPLVAGSSLASGSRLRTGATGSVTLRFADGSRLLVVPETELALEQLLSVGADGRADIRLRLDRGNVDALVPPAPERPPRFEIRTPAINLGVRGTEFRARVTPGEDKSFAEVLRGLVASADGRAELPLPAGFGVAVRPGQPQGQAQALLPAPDLQALPARLERLPLSLSWAPMPGVSGYRAQVLAADAPDQLKLDGRFATATAKWADLPDGRYLLRVRAIDAMGLEGKDAVRAFTLKARPEPPFIRQPAASAKVYGDSVIFNWAASSAAGRYRLQVATSADFAPPLLFDSSDIQDTEHKLALPPGSYHWRLASITADGEAGPFGDAQTFSQHPVPPSPALETPKTDRDGLLFRWPQPAPGQRVQFQFAADAEFKQLLLDQTTDAAELRVPLPPPGSYHLRIRAIDADGFVGNFGTPQQVQVPVNHPWWLLLPLGALLLLL